MEHQVLLGGKSAHADKSLNVSYFFHTCFLPFQHIIHFCSRLMSQAQGCYYVRICLCHSVKLPPVHRAE